MSLEFEHITHRFADSPSGAPVLDDVSLAVSPGEILTLFGPSGCGKTTLLRLAAGHARVQSGVIRLNGAVLADARQTTPPEDRPVGFVFQDYVLFPHLTVEQNIRFGLKGLAKDEQHQRTNEQISGLSLTGLEKRFPHELSGGQQQRVAIARALVRKPSALLLDEPFASLGMRLRQSLQEDMRRVLKQNDVAAVFVTHDPEEALTMGDRVALMREGTLLSAATPHSLFTAPKSLEAAMIFDRHQLVEGRVINNHLETPLGNFTVHDQYSTHLAPVIKQCFASPGDVSVVIDASSIHIRERDGGDFIVVDCRFTGPDWTVFIQPVQSQHSPSTLIRCYSTQGYTSGTQLSCAVDASALKWISSIPV